MEKKDLLFNLGNKVRLARISKGITQTELANIIGKDQPSINRLEKGRINPSYIYLTEICEGLNISISELESNYFNI